MPKFKELNRMNSKFKLFSYKITYLALIQTFSGYYLVYFNLIYSGIYDTINNYGICNALFKHYLEL